MEDVVKEENTVHTASPPPPDDERTAPQSGPVAARQLRGLKLPLHQELLSLSRAPPTPH